MYSESLAGAGKKQDFLEASPYWDQSGVPVNTYKNKTPFKGNVISTKRIVGVAATGETTHIIINHDGKMPYWEGQSYGVIPPGENPKKPGKPNTVRLYSIASSRYGDDMTGTTTSLCVRRATYWCPELKADDPAKKGAPAPLLRPRPSSRTRAIIRRRSARACGGRARLRGAVRRGSNSSRGAAAAQACAPTSCATPSRAMRWR